MKTRKRILLLCLTLALLMFALPARAAEPELTYEVRDNGVWITGAYGAFGDLVLPEEIEGVPVVGIAQGAFQNNTALTSLTLPEGLRFIGAFAFANCTKLQNCILIPDTVEWIGTMAFRYPSLRAKAYSAGHRYAIQNPLIMFDCIDTDSGKQTVQQDGLTFWLHNGEAELVYIPPEISGTLCIPETVEGCPVTAISPNCRGSATGSTKLYHVVMPGTVERIGAYAFYNSRLSSIFVSEGVKELQEYALCTNSADTILTLPSSLTLLEDHAFAVNASGEGMPTVYAYEGSPAAIAAQRENANLIRREGVDGCSYGCYTGINYTSAKDGAVITAAQVNCSNVIPAYIDGIPVTEIELRDFIPLFYGGQSLTIPPTVTMIHDELIGYQSYYAFFVWPNSYAEKYCREKGYQYESVFTAKGVPFSDVPEGRWYYEAVCYAYHTGLMSGVSDSRFAPEDTTSRAMLVTVLWRLAGCPEATAPAAFEDVTKGSWYEKAVSWAAEQGIVQGVSASRFAPDAPVTREQIAAILLRYAKHCGRDDGMRSNVSGFPDAPSISSWAMEGIRWAKANGILSGQLSGTEVYLNPLAGAKRSEIAVMLMRFSILQQK